MTDRFVESFVEKLVLLEECAGATVPYRNVAPFPVDVASPAALQATTKMLAESIGLSDCVFVVGRAKQGENVGGTIDSQSGALASFIEVDSDCFALPQLVVATLCHELCHKWLDRHCLRASTTEENEFLTDITSVFLGFGKLVLNGCVGEYTTQEPLADGTRTITHTHRVGYLDRNQFAFVYGLVCAMRRVPEREAMSGLNAGACDAVRFNQERYGRHFDQALHDPLVAKGNVREFEREIYNTQLAVSKAHRHAAHVREWLCEPAEEAFRGRHRQLQELMRKAEASVQEGGPDPALRFLRNLGCRCVLERLTEEAGRLRTKADDDLEKTRVVARTLAAEGSIGELPADKGYATVTCPGDGTILRLPDGVGDIAITCPRCKCRFAYPSGPVVLDATATPGASDNPKASTRSRTSKWLRRLFRAQ